MGFSWNQKPGFTINPPFFGKWPIVIPDKYRAPADTPAQTAIKEEASSSASQREAIKKYAPYALVGVVALVVLSR